MARPSADENPCGFDREENSRRTGYVCRARFRSVDPFRTRDTRDVRPHARTYHTAVARNATTSQHAPISPPLARSPVPSVSADPARRFHHTPPPPLIGFRPSRLLGNEKIITPAAVRRTPEKIYDDVLKNIRSTRSPSRPARSCRPVSPSLFSSSSALHSLARGTGPSTVRAAPRHHVVVRRNGTEKHVTGTTRRVIYRFRRTRTPPLWRFRFFPTPPTSLPGRHRCGGGGVFCRARSRKHDATRRKPRAARRGFRTPRGDVTINNNTHVPRRD